ncbi:MAG: hypothetical protein K0R38_7902 [Polyangiaceae bacterium]|nr:hypothetical protein [Polyangiaceae bacterium]
MAFVASEQRCPERGQDGDKSRFDVGEGREHERELPLLLRIEVEHDDPRVHGDDALRHLLGRHHHRATQLAFEHAQRRWGADLATDTLEQSVQAAKVEVGESRNVIDEHGFSEDWGTKRPHGGAQ